MTDRIVEFVSDLAKESQHELRGLTATLRLDIVGTGELESWLLQIDDGRVAVSRRHGHADAVMTATAPTFLRLIAGEANALTGTLRGDLDIEGDVRLLMAFRRLLPGPASRRTSVPPARSSRLPSRDRVPGGRRPAGSNAATSRTRRRERSR